MFIWSCVIYRFYKTRTDAHALPLTVLHRASRNLQKTPVTFVPTVKPDSGLPAQQSRPPELSSGGRGLARDSSG